MNKFKYKMAIVVRKDLEMSAGKLAGQCSHAAVGCYKTKRDLELDLYINNFSENVLMTIEERIEVIKQKNVAFDWFDEGQVKVILQVPSEIELQNLAGKCITSNVPHYEVRDFGLTELEPNTFTCIGIGPDLSENINKITGNLKLYK